MNEQMWKELKTWVTDRAHEMRERMTSCDVSELDEYASKQKSLMVVWSRMVNMELATKAEREKERCVPDHETAEEMQDWFDEFHSRSHAAVEGDEISTCHIPGIGTVRPCRCCGTLVAGGPTICMSCVDAKQLAPTVTVKGGGEPHDKYPPGTPGAEIRGFDPTLDPSGGKTR